MNILLTGAAGFIGCHLTKRLLAEGHLVIGIDNFLTGSKKNIEEFLDNPRFEFIEQDVIYPITIEAPLDWVLHFASPASPPKYCSYPIDTLRVNSEGTMNMLNLAVLKGARFFLASTSEVYGDPLIHPQPEYYWGNVNPNGVRSVYDEGKRYAEAITMAYHRRYNLSTRIVRIFNTYGPNMDPGDGRVVSNFINQALAGIPITIYGDGLQTRSFQYIDDLLSGIIRLMEVEYHQPVNLGNPEEYSVRHFAEIIKSELNPQLDMKFCPLPQDDPLQRKPDISVAQEILNWQPRVGLSEGLARTIQFFKELAYGIAV